MSQLQATAHIKPLDFGNGRITGSIGPDGRFIALNFYHRDYGYATLTSAQPFPEHERYSPDKVRAYRASLAALPGFGYRFSQAGSPDSILIEDAIPQVTLDFGENRFAQVVTLDQPHGVVQYWQCQGVTPRWQGTVSLQRCAYTQLTEGGPIPIPPIKMQVTFQNGVLILENPLLGSAVAVVGFPYDDNNWEESIDDIVTIDIAGQSGASVLAYGFGSTAAEALEHAQMYWKQDFHAQLELRRRIWQERWRNVPSNGLVRRGLVYGLSMCVSNDEGVCVLTDHMLLPLSWNRDAYYVVVALLHWHPSMAPLVRAHLIWLFEIAERVGEAWGRCYLANGKIKDRAYQLDQQLFPLLELTDYILNTHDVTLMDRLRRQVTAVIDSLLQRKAAHDWLFPTDETPADDPIDQPYHLSSHILLWYTLIRLVQAGFGSNAADLAARVKESIQKHFIVQRADGSSIYAYAIDGRGSTHLYHDANDLPLVLAPLWGFVSADDATWRATIDFAFSDANVGGFYAGHVGSVHTRAAWPLGDIQDLLVGIITQDTPRQQRAWQSLHFAAQRDGALPEAYDSVSGAVISRYWFAWPNAALACIVLKAFEP